MSNLKISELQSAGSLIDGDILVGVNSGSTRKFSMSQIASYIQSKVINGIIVSASEPDSVQSGSVWFDTNRNQLRVFDGSVWKWIGGRKIATILTRNPTMQLSDDTWTALRLGNPDEYDPDDTHGSNNSYMTIPEDGLYRVELSAEFDPIIGSTVIAGGRGIAFHKGNAPYTSGTPSNPLAFVGHASADVGSSSAHSTIVHGSTMLVCSAGDVLTAVAKQVSGHDGLVLLRARFVVELIGYSN